MKPTVLPRRVFLAAAGAGAAGAVLGGCGNRSGGRGIVTPDSGPVRAREARRHHAGAAVRDITLIAAPVTVDLGGRSAATWTYGDELPATEVRVRAGQVLRARLRNLLPDPTTIHWHGIALRNDMDGVPNLTQAPVAPGAEFTYEFTVPDPGTYFFHPHVGVQLDRGLYGALVVEDPAEPGGYDRELLVVLDDWTDGVGRDPEQLLTDLQRGMGGMMMDATTTSMPDAGGMGTAGGMGMMSSTVLGGDAGDVRYPLYLLDGRHAGASRTLGARPGERVRLRIINAGSDTAFRLALGGHRLTVTHTDGFPVHPVTGDALLIGMGERYDAIVRLGDGAFPLVALAEGKGTQTGAVLRTSGGATPRLDTRPPQLDGRLLTAADLVAARNADLGERHPDRTHDVVLEGGMHDYRWTINGRTFDHAIPLDVRQGQRVRLWFDNRTMMFHPMHLHGHTFQVRRADGRAGPRKDTVIVRPGERIAVDLDADNPGQWALHCHNAYHAEVGMMTTLAYLA